MIDRPAPAYARPRPGRARERRERRQKRKRPSGWRLLVGVLIVILGVSAACLIGLTLASGFSGLAASSPPTPARSPTLEDFWEGRAAWAIDVFDVGLPVGESETVYLGNGRFRSYTHASYQSAGIVDQCGDPVPFPGCLVTWYSTDGGVSFQLNRPVCALPCLTCPCTDERDHIRAQQYPRVAYTEDTGYLVYEWHAQTMLRTSSDGGVTWSNWSRITRPAGTWPSSYNPCSPVERIGPHPHIRGEEHDCLVGAPPGIYIEDDELYIFVGAGSAPGHMRCYRGNRHEGAAGLRLCDTDPLFSGAFEYGPIDAAGAAANPYFDFRYVSSATVLKVGDHYYMAYEGVRGPDQLERGMDTQFGLGFARSVFDRIDGPWMKYRGNPVLADVGFWVGIGHADLLIVDGETILYTQTGPDTRGRYRLVWSGR